METEIIRNNLDKIIKSSKKILKDYNDIKYIDMINSSPNIEKIISELAGFCLINEEGIYCLVFMIGEIKDVKKRNEYVMIIIKYIEEFFDYIIEIKSIKESEKKIIQILFKNN